MTVISKGQGGFKRVDAHDSDLRDPSFGFPRGFQVDLDSHADSQADSECCESVTKKLRIPALVDSQPRGFPPRSIHRPK